MSRHLDDDLNLSTELLVEEQGKFVPKAQACRCYSAYGYEVLEARQSLIGFNGNQRDVALGCDLLGNGVRAYNPVLMRFCSPDTLSPFSVGGINAYMYCGGDPINFADPDGHVRTKNPPSQSPWNYGRRAESYTFQAALETDGLEQAARQANTSLLPGTNSNPPYIQPITSSDHKVRISAQPPAGRGITADELKPYRDRVEAHFEGTTRKLQYPIEDYAVALRIKEDGGSPFASITHYIITAKPEIKEHEIRKMNRVLISGVVNIQTSESARTHKKV